MSDADPDGSEDDSGGTTKSDADQADADTFGVGIHVTDEELQFVVHVPSSISSGWTDPESFQRLVERVVWDHLDQEATLRPIASSTPTGETVTLGTVTLQPDGTVVDHNLSTPDVGPDPTTT